MKNFYRKVAFGLKPEEKAPSDPLTWAQKQVETIPELNWKGKYIYLSNLILERSQLVFEPMLMDLMELSLLVLSQKLLF